MNIAAELTDIRRRLDNMIRVGVITEVNLSDNTCRVQSGQLHTNFLPWVTPRAGRARLWWPPEVGEQVTIYSLGGQTGPDLTGFVGPSLYCDNNPPPSRESGVLVIQFDDNARLSYDSNSSSLDASGMKHATLTTSEDITATSQQVTVKAEVRVLLDTPEVECTNMLIAKSLSITEGGEMKGNIEHSGGSFSSNGIVVDKHKHSGVKGGESESGGPVQ